MVLILYANPYRAAWTDEVNLLGVEVSSPNLPCSPRRTCGDGTLGMAELVLVVEDEAHVRELVSYTLQGAGYRVVAVDDGESALREIGLAMPNLIVLDVRLPGRRLGLLLERETLIQEAVAIDALRAVDRAKSDFIAK